MANLGRTCHATQKRLAMQETTSTAEIKNQSAETGWDPHPDYTAWSDTQLNHYLEQGIIDERIAWQDVQLDRSIIEIRRSLSIAKVKGETNQDRFRWFDPKTKRGIRDIPVPVQLISALREWKEKCPKSRLDLVFCNQFGEPRNRTGIGRDGLSPALREAGIDKAVTLHGLRHTYASMLIHLGRKLPQISRYLGHKDVSIAMRVYAHFLESKK